ncbi:MAG: LamG domain-containing protein [Nanoarchaeota archaeon]
MKKRDMYIIKNRTLYFIFFIILFLFFVNALPLIDFIAPTLSSGSFRNQANATINISIIENNLQEVKFNWNGTNFTIYDDSLILMLGFNNYSVLGENGTYAVDVSKYSNNATLNNTIFNSTGGRYNGALNFNRVNSTVTILNNTMFDISTDLTIEAWIKVLSSTPSGQYSIVSKGGTDFYDLLYDYTGPIGVSFELNPTGQTCGELNNSDINLTDSQYHHVVGMRTGNLTTANLSIYIDGNFEANVILSCSTNINVTEGDIVIGNRQGDLFNGSIDEVRIWNRSFTNDEIRELYYSNLYKFNQTQWYLYVEQLNLTSNNYTYFASAKNISGNENLTATRSVTIDTIIPNNTINSVTTTADSTSITVNITSSDVNLNNCFYSIFADITTLVIANTTYTCNTIISTSVNQFTSHTFYSYVNDSAGNLNQTTRNFTTTRSGNVGGGGGGASPVVITLYNFTVIYDKTWELSTSNNITIKTYDINNNFTDVDSVNIVLLNAFDNQTNISHRESIVRRIKKGEYYKEFIVDYSDKDNIQFNITVKQHTKSLQKIIGVDLVSPAIPPLFSRVEDITQTLLSRFRDYLLRNGNLLRVLYFVFLTITIISIMIYLVVKHRNNKNNNNI